MPRIFLCRRNEIDDNESRELVVNDLDPPLELFLVCRNGTIHAYQNHCPHTGVNLNWQPHQFLDITGQFVQCSTHGALFRIADGQCIRGPCLGQSLKRLPLDIDSDDIYLQL